MHSDAIKLILTFNLILEIQDITPMVSHHMYGWHQIINERQKWHGTLLVSPKDQRYPAPSSTTDWSLSTPKTRQTRVV